MKTRAPSGNYPRLGGKAMHPDTPRMNLAGFRDMTAIMAYCANKPLNIGGGIKL